MVYLFNFNLSGTISFSFELSEEVMDSLSDENMAFALLVEQLLLKHRKQRYGMWLSY